MLVKHRFAISKTTPRFYQNPSFRVRGSPKFAKFAEAQDFTNILPSESGAPQSLPNLRRRRTLPKSFLQGQGFPKVCQIIGSCGSDVTGPLRVDSLRVAGLRAKYHTSRYRFCVGWQHPEPQLDELTVPLRGDIWL